MRGFPASPSSPRDLTSRFPSPARWRTACHAFPTEGDDDGEAQAGGGGGRRRRHRVPAATRAEPGDLLAGPAPRGPTHAARRRPGRARRAHRHREPGRAPARLALKDRYLAEVSGGVPAGGSVVPAYALQRSSRQTLLFAAHGDRLVIVSDAGMVLDADGKVSAAARPVLEALLGEASAGYYHARLGLEPGGRRHRVVVGARYLSFGCQRFFPAVQALSFDFGPEGWATRVRFDRRALPAGGFEPSVLWRLAPVAPSACFALPVDWAAAATLVSSLEAD